MLQSRMTPPLYHRGNAKNMTASPPGMAAGHPTNGMHSGWYGRRIRVQVLNKHLAPMKLAHLSARRGAPQKWLKPRDRPYLDSFSKSSCASA